MRKNKFLNFILEFSQILLVFLGVFSAIMCTATSLELTFDMGICAYIMLGSSVLFYGLFTVLETFRRGKLYGILGLLFFYAALIFRFNNAIKKGAVTIVNSFLKQFMNYSGSRMTLLTYNDKENVSPLFCTNLLLILTGVLIIAIASAFFYRKRRSKIFLFMTAPFVAIPLVIGRLGYFSNLFTYLIVTITIVGTRHMKTDATDRRMRQKLSLILMMLGLMAGGISYLYMPPERYERGKPKILEVQNSILTMSTWSADDIMTFFHSYFNDDAISFGKIGKTEEVVYSGRTLIRIRGNNLNTNHSLYLKGFTGDVYENNKWTSVEKNEEYASDLEALEIENLSPDSWHIRLRNALGASETSGVYNLWGADVMEIQNLAFGYGNYLVPYEPTAAIKTENNGRVAVDKPGVQYSVEYYNVYSQVMRRDFWAQNFSIAPESYWNMMGNITMRDKMEQFAKKYYLQVPDSAQDVVKDFKDYLKKNGDYYDKFKSGTANEADMVNEVKNYINSKVSYSLSPGKTPSDMESMDYFLNTSKKGYCTYYATTAAILLRSVGIPTRYVEGMCVPRDQLQGKEVWSIDKGSGEVKHKTGGRNSEWIDVPDEDAHAWVEVYDNKYGFVPLEVTPGRGEDDEDISHPSETASDKTESDGGSVQQQEQKDDDKKEEEAEGKITPTPSVTEKPEESMEFDDIDGNEELSDEEARQARKKTAAWILLDLLVIIVLVLLVFELQRRIRLYMFKRRQKLMKGRRKVRMMYHHILPVFLSEGIIYRGQTMAEYTSQIAEAMQMEENEIAFFVQMLYRARFGLDDIKAEEMKQYSDEFRNIRNHAYKQAKLWRRLYYKYIAAL